MSSSPFFPISYLCTGFIVFLLILNSISFPGGSVGEESVCNVADPGSVPGWGRSPGEGNDNPFQYSCLENSMDRGAMWTAVRGVAESWTRLSDFHFKLHNSFCDPQLFPKSLNPVSPCPLS